MADPYQYFRIEARELTDELAAGLSGLLRGGPTAELVGGLLRHAHTLKGAARVVAAVAIADGAHELEELLGGYRGGTAPIPEADLDRLQALVDRITSALPAPLQPPAPEPLEPPLPEPTPAPAVLTPPPLPNPRDHARSHAPHSRDHAIVPATGEPHSTGTAPGGPRPEAAENQQTARASLAEIDSVIQGVGQALTQLGLLRECASRVARFRDRPDVVGHIKVAADEIQRVVAGCADRMDRELRQVHDVAERLRLVPVESIVPDLERGARDVAAAQGKRVRVDVSGGRIRLDAPVLAIAQAALRQIIRNAVAHGIEEPAERVAAGKDAIGHVRLDVVQSAGRVLFNCSDDGRGIDLGGVRRELARAGRTGPGMTLSDPQVLELLLLGGISTAATVSEISGHGIGLDVVQDAVQRLGGDVSISTEAGRGTTIALTTPLSLVAQDVVLVDAGLVDPETSGAKAGLGGPLEPGEGLRSSPRNTWLGDPGAVDPGPVDTSRVRALTPSTGPRLVAVPLAAIRETVRVRADEIERGPWGETLVHRGRTIPFLPLAAALGDTTAGGHSCPAWSVLLLSESTGNDGASELVGIGVRRLIGISGVAIHALPELAPVSDLLAGVWIDVDGLPRLVLEPSALIAAAGRQQSAGETPAPAPRAPILIVDDSLTTRMLEQSILESAGYQVELASSAEEGLMLAASRPFSLVLVDVEMPGMDGFAFVEQTRARPELRHLPCILVTTRASAQDRLRGLHAGARAHIDKNEFYQGTLLDRISELLADG